MSDIVLHQVKELLTKLTLAEKADVVAWLGLALKTELPLRETTQRHSARGLWADLGPAPSIDEIDDARRDTWGNFPRHDI